MPDQSSLKQIVEAALLAAGRPLSLDQMQGLFEEEGRPNRAELQRVVEELQADYQGRGIALAQVAGGYRVQVRAAYAPWVSRLWEEKPARYSRALMETLALIAYRQPITRGEIEDIRGVSVSTNITRTLLERDWVRVVGHRDVPGRPALYATTRTFLEYFGLRSLDDLPNLAELRDLDSINRELELREPGTEDSAASAGVGGALSGEGGTARPEAPDEQVGSEISGAASLDQSPAGESDDSPAEVLGDSAEMPAAAQRVEDRPVPSVPVQADTGNAALDDSDSPSHV
jgi:segregation and condensation protein B